MSRHCMAVAAFLLLKGCAGGLEAYNMAACEKRIDRATDKVEALDIPPEKKEEIKEELDDAKARANLGFRYNSPTKKAPEVDLGSEEDNKEYNALEGKAHGAKRRQKVKDALWWPFKMFFKVLRFIRQWGWTIAMLALGFWAHHRFKQLFGIEVRRDRDLDVPLDQKRKWTEGTPAQDLYRRDRKKDVDSKGG